ncbi:sensor histidine kinase [Methylobacterium sp. NEAU K]|nr:sensor histidine kinase [Methylobacterium sp. NEAU K]MDP4006055.1 sensor histidine kinase [Methylobacterium sp. NEAU K]
MGFEDLSALDHVLVLAPYRKDAIYLGRLLSEHGIRVETASGIDDIVAQLATLPGVLVTTHEALTPAVLKAVAVHLRSQPAWSEMPIVVLLDRASPNARMRAELSRAWPRARQLFYQRPVTPVELVSGVQSALLARLRQRDVRDHIAREIELRRELNHRVKNILASVTSIFEMTRRGATSIEEFAEDFRGRLGALAKVHSAVFHAAGEIVPVQEIADITFSPYRLTGEDRITARGPTVMLHREAGTTLALCLHELTTNAIKYGALSKAEGRVLLEWTVSDDEPRELSISWRESNGPPVTEPVRAGYGTRYLRAALTGMFGQKPVIAFHPEGLRCEARGSLARVSCNQ